VSAASSGIPLWGQAWELTITCATAGGGAQPTVVSSNAWEPEALRVTFDVLQAMNTSPLWYADIAVYNMDDQKAQNIAYNASWVTLKAGFQFGPQQSSIIWDGPVFQVLYTRENVVDQKLTLHCVVFPAVSPTDIVGFSMGIGSTQQQQVVRMIAETNMSVRQGAVAQARMTATQYPRGNTVFGKVSKFFAQLADSNLVQTWNDSQRTYISEVGGKNSATSAAATIGAAAVTSIVSPNLIYSPAFPPGGTGTAAGLPPGTNQSIIGTPQQTQQGVDFTVLLDPRLQVQLPPLLVQLVRTQITQLQRTPSPNSDLPTALQSNLTFFAAQVRHTGDTRGNDWQTEVTGWSTAYAQALLNLWG
jgi:hypothetical protein